MSLSGVAGRVLGAPPRLGSVRLVCVDGPAGSGKTTFAGALAERLPGALVLHMDDLYDGWDGLATVWPRVEQQVLAPLACGRPARWQRYDWSLGRFGPWHLAPVPRVLVLEGCGSAPRAVDGRTSCRVWVEAPEAVRLGRGAARDGEHLRGRWEAWVRTERSYFELERTRERADVRVDGVAGWAP